MKNDEPVLVLMKPEKAWEMAEQLAALKRENASLKFTLEQYRLYFQRNGMEEPK